MTPAEGATAPPPPNLCLGMASSLSFSSSVWQTRGIDLAMTVQHRRLEYFATMVFEIKVDWAFRRYKGRVRRIGCHL